MNLLIINRHCNYSVISANKKRPDWFSREKCFNNLLETTKGRDDVSIHVLFDGSSTGHFTENRGITVKEIAAKSGAKSFIMSMDYALDIAKDSDTLIYFLEDDYMHIPGWVDVLYEGINIVPDGYVSLYDHNDKYFLPQYVNLKSQIFTSKSSHWRTTPSTTDTFAIKPATLKKHYNIMKKWSDMGLNYSQDHKRCLDLWENGVPLITPIPGYSTHCEDNLLSPIIKWESI